MIVARPSPASSYDEAIERVRALSALDDGSILPRARTALLDRGQRAPYAVVLLHGLTNHPGQFVQFAPLVHAAGANVLVPRLPEHGDANRMTGRLARLTAERLVDATTEALDIACGLGERVAVLGISMGGVLAAYAGQYRSDVHVAVPVSPMFALLNLPYGMSRCAAAVFLRLPNMFMWWDPRAKMAQHPLTAYPRFSTHALMQTLRVGDEVYRDARGGAPKADRIHVVVNRADPAVNNRATAVVVNEWRSRRNAGIACDVLSTLPKNHDIIDPDNDEQRVAQVYPVLLAALELS